MWPSVYDINQKRIYDLPSKLLEDNIILINEQITDQMSASVVAQLLTLESKDPNKPITIYINSPGGSVSAGFAIYDVMNNISNPIITIANGLAASMAAILLSSGTRGQRYAMPNSTIMIHQPLGAAQGQASEISIMAQQILKTKEKLNILLSKNTGTPLTDIIKACDRDNYLNAEEALKLGIIDKIIKIKPKAFNQDLKIPEI